MSEHEFDRLAAFAEHQLDAQEQARVGAHVAACDQCTRALADVRRGIALANELEPIPMPSNVANAIRARTIPARRWRPSLAAAAVLAMMVGAASYWQLNRPWATMLTLKAAPTSFELDGRNIHAALAGTAELDYLPRDDRDAWEWLAAQRGPVAGLLPNHSADERDRFRVAGAAVRTVGGARASVVSYRIDGKPVTLVLANRRDVPGAPPAGLLSKPIMHRRDENGANVLTWSVGGGTYVMVSELDDAGQRACSVCHTGQRFQTAIASLRPR